MVVVGDSARAMSLGAAIPAKGRNPGREGSALGPTHQFDRGRADDCFRRRGAIRLAPPGLPSRFPMLDSIGRNHTRLRSLQCHFRPQLDSAGDGLAIPTTYAPATLSTLCPHGPRLCPAGCWERQNLATVGPHVIGRHARSLKRGQLPIRICTSLP